MGNGRKGTPQGTSEHEARHCSESVCPLLGSHTGNLSHYSRMLEEGTDLPEAVQALLDWDVIRLSQAQKGEPYGGRA